MNIYYFDKQINNLAAKQNRTCAEQTRLCEMLQDADAAGYTISYDKESCKYIITGGRQDG